MQFIDLEARLSEVETRLRAQESVVASLSCQQQLACADQPRLAAVSCSPKQPPSSRVVRMVGWRFDRSVARN